jgi:hypothetical protein
MMLLTLILKLMLEPHSIRNLIGHVTRRRPYKAKAGPASPAFEFS